MKRVEQLDDYVAGVMPEALAESFEEEMFAAAARGDDDDDRWYDRFHRLMLYIGESGMFVRGAYAEDVEALKSHGLRVHVVDLGAGGRCDWTKPRGEVDLIVTKVSCDIRGWNDVDAEVYNPSGRHVYTFKDVLPDPTSGNLFAICAPNLALLGFGTVPRVTKITGVRPGHTEREEIAVYESTPV